HLRLAHGFANFAGCSFVGRPTDLVADPLLDVFSESPLVAGSGHLPAPSTKPRDRCCKRGSLHPEGPIERPESASVRYRRRRGATRRELAAFLMTSFETLKGLATAIDHVRPPRAHSGFA